MRSCVLATGFRKHSGKKEVRTSDEKQLRGSDAVYHDEMLIIPTCKLLVKT